MWEFPRPTSGLECARTHRTQPSHSTLGYSLVQQKDTIQTVISQGKLQRGQGPGVRKQKDSLTCLSEQKA